MKKLVVISGATATGKTSISIEIAKNLSNSCIVNFDSLLFYNELNIGTAKPTVDEMCGIEHHMIGHVSAKSPINAAEYIKQATPLINELLSKDKQVILVGGSGFYLRALLHGMYSSGDTPDEIQQKSDELYHAEGIDPFIKELTVVDPEIMQELHQNDHYRIRRALEHYWSTGVKFSKSKEKLELKKSHRNYAHNWHIHHIHLDIPKAEHWPIMKERVEQMLAQGLIAEVNNLLQNGFSGEEKPLKSIGYKEVIDFIKGQITSEEELIERIFINTRRLAKSQRTWFNKVENKFTFHTLNNRQQIIESVLSFFNSDT